jgi:hypothetical protein
MSAAASPKNKLTSDAQLDLTFLAKNSPTGKNALGARFEANTT